MRSIDFENLVGFKGTLRPHTEAVHTDHEWDRCLIPDGDPIPPNYKVVRFYIENENIGDPFKTKDGNTYQTFHTHNKSTHSYIGLIPVDNRIVEED
jgi:hypothetical protein